MAMAKLDGTITNIDGKVGGNIFRNDVCGQHIQATPRHIDKKSPAQLRQRRAFLRALRFCNERRMTWEEFNSWWLYTIFHPVTNKKAKDAF